MFFDILMEEQITLEKSEVDSISKEQKSPSSRKYKQAHGSQSLEQSPPPLESSSMSSLKGR
jgi:hypothetical protein